MDWCGYFELAKELASLETEAHQRSAISRAYYSAYGCAVQWLREHEAYDPAKGDSHAQVWYAFTRPIDGSLRLGSGVDRLRKQIGITGDRLKRKRVDADYRVSVSDLQNKVELSLKEARKMLGLIEELYRRVQEK